MSIERPHTGPAMSGNLEVLPDHKPKPLYELTEDLFHLTQKSDAVDHITGRFPSSINLASIMAVGTVAYAEGYFRHMETELAPHATSLTLALGAGAVAYASGELVRARRRKEARQIMDIQDTISRDYFEGERIELYRRKKMTSSDEEVHDGLLIWNPGAEYGNGEKYPEEKVLDRFDKLEQMARQTGATKVAIPYSLAQEHFGDWYVNDGRGNTYYNDPISYPHTQIIKNIKSDVADVSKQQPRLTLISQIQLQAKLMEAVPRAREDQDPLADTMRLLAAYRPNHPSLFKYNVQRGQDAADSHILEQSLKLSIEKRLNDVEAERVALDETISSRTKQKRYLQGTLSKNAETGMPVIKWRKSGDFNHATEQDLLEYANTTRDELASLEDIVGEIPEHRLIELCEIKALLALYNKIKSKPVLTDSDEMRFRFPKPPKPGEAGHEPIKGFQDRVFDRFLSSRANKEAKRLSDVSIRPGLALRVGASAVVLSVAMMGGAATESFVSKYEKSTNDSIAAALLEEGLDSNEAESLRNGQLYRAASLLGDAKRTLVGAADTITPNVDPHIPSPVDNLAHTLGDMLGEPPFDADAALRALQEKWVDNAGEPYEDTSLYSTVGNVGDEFEKNKPIWKLTGNRMPTDGYWTMQTAEELSKRGVAWLPRSITKELFEKYDVLPNEVERVAQQELETMPELAKADSVSASQPYIKVERLISTAEAYAKSGSGYDNFGAIDNKYAVPVPVLDGTEVVAATFGDDETPILKAILDDGTTTLIVHNDDEIGAPQKLTYILAPNPEAHVRATDPVEIEHDNKYPDMAWAYMSNVPTYIPAEQRLAQQATFIKENFTYELRPFDKGEDPARMDVSRYALEVLSRRQANCNVANTLLAISNPGLLNYATGYYNTGRNTDGTDHLSTAERHAYTVRFDGSIVDATPPGGPNSITPNAAENFSKEKSNKPNHDVELAFGLGILAAGAVWQRRRILGTPAAIGHASNSLRRSRLEKSLKKLGEDQVDQAYRTTAHILYSDRPLTDTDVISNAARDTRLDSEKWSQLLGTDETISVSLKRAAKRTKSPEVKQAVKTAQKVAKIHRKQQL